MALHCTSSFFFLRTGMTENEYQAKLIKRIEELVPGSIVLKNDPNYLQGIPDLLILYHDKWAMLEVKRSAKDKHRPNQDYYIDLFGEWVYSSFIFPENEEVVLYELQQALGVAR